MWEWRLATWSRAPVYANKTSLNCLCNDIMVVSEAPLVDINYDDKQREINGPQFGSYGPPGCPVNSERKQEVMGWGDFKGEHKSP